MPVRRDAAPRWRAPFRQVWRDAARRWPGRLRVPAPFRRRLRVLRPGGFLIFGTMSLGVAAINTGNNLLYLLMGALLGTIQASGWLSEQALRKVTVQRSLPRAVTAGVAARITYTVSNGKQRLPSHGLTITERIPDQPSAGTGREVAVAPAFVPVLEAGARVRVGTEVTAARRGLVQLAGVELGTAFPFGLFSKSRDQVLHGSLIVWPRTDRTVREPRPAGPRGLRVRAGAGATAGAERGDYRGLREYRTGDDPRDIHWRSTARRGEPITREYDRAAADEYWVVLDTRGRDPAAGDAAVETAAALLAAAARRGERCGLLAGGIRVKPSSAGVRLDDALDVLAAVEFSGDAPPPVPPAPPDACVLVTTAGADGDWADVFMAGAEAVE